jgi:hypothetical protein
MRTAVALAIVAAANLWVLADVARNRAGAPESRVQLTARELPRIRLGDEDTGFALALPRLRNSDYTWLDRAKLAGLGFHGSPGRTFVPLLRPAYVALEYRPGAEPGLVAVDADRDARTLRTRYPDRTRFIVTRGTVRPAFTNVFLLVTRVNVPLPYSRTLAGMKDYRATLCYGRDYEPWLCGLDAAQ